MAACRGVERLAFVPQLIGLERPAGGNAQVHGAPVQDGRRTNALRFMAV